MKKINQLARPIIFRGKSDMAGNRGQWVYGSLVMGLNDKYEIWYEKAGRLKKNPVIKYTIGQCTGIKDRNGKDIYEGDIVTDDMFNKGFVMWDKIETGFYINSLEAPNVSDIVGWRILGNIHDNHELLGDEDD